MMTEQTMTWKGSTDLSALRGKPVYVRFFLRNATLYTFKVTGTGHGGDNVNVVH